MSAALDWFRRKFAFTEEKPAPAKRSVDYAAAISSRLTAGMASYSLSANQEIYRSLRALRARSRELARDNAHAKKFLQMVESNVIGPDGIILQNKAGDFDAAGRFVLDTIANNQIERAWRDWGRRGTCEVTGRMSWPAVQRLYVRTMARDGEVLLRRITDRNRNRYGYALQFIDVDRLDERYNDDLPNGNIIRMSIELNREGRPVAYHVRNRHPGDYLTGTDQGYGERERIPADQIIHDFLQDRPEQIRGVPWMHAAMLRLSHLGAFDEAAIIAARIGAAKMGFFTAEDGDVAGLSDGEDELGNLMTEVDPGIFGVLPRGYDFKSFDPKYPEANYDGFTKACLRGIASGFGVSYNSLASDLEGVSYSSIRQGVLDERDAWKTIQAVVVDGLMQPTFSDWLSVALLRGAIGNLPAAKLSKFKADTWQPRRWQWVDPANDIEAATAAVALGVKSRRQIAAEQGDDLDDILLEQEQEKTRMEELGLIAPQAAAPSIGDGAPGDGEAKPVKDAQSDVQSQALNGAQLSSLQAIVQSVAEGTLPKESAIQLVMIAIPTITNDQAGKLINPAASFKPKKAEGDAAA